MSEEEIISSASLDVLPFKPEPIAQWMEDTDLLEYLRVLYDLPCAIVDSEGTESETNYREYGHYLFNNGKQEYQTIAKNFRKKAARAQPTAAAEQRVEEIPDFQEDVNFGLMAKYAVAWDAILSAILSESVFFSLAHALESNSDINCSMLLASNLYYTILLHFLSE